MGKPHRSYTPEFKVRVVLELLSGKRTLGEASREYNIKDSVISRWRQEFLERAPQIFEQSSEKNDQTDRIAELERALGRMTMQLELAKKVFGDSDFLSRSGA
jgi:transposase-like protein